MEKIFFEGFFLQASLIFALGAQNIFVLESGLQRKHHLIVSFVCFACDLTLILLGVIGAAALFNVFPNLKFFIGIIGVFFLFWYGLKKLTSVENFILDSNKNGTNTILKSIILAATFSILNPHAYLDAFILIGGYASKYSSIEERITLGLGAGIYSGVWFLALSSLSSQMKSFFMNPLRAKYLFRFAGVILIMLSGKLAFEVLNWIPVNYEISKLKLYSAIIY